MKKKISIVFLLLVFSALIFFSLVLIYKSGASVFFSKEEMNLSEVYEHEGEVFFRYPLNTRYWLSKNQTVLLTENGKPMSKVSFSLLNSGYESSFSQEQEYPPKDVFFIPKDRTLDGKTFILFYPSIFLSRDAGFFYLALAVLALFTAIILRKKKYLCLENSTCSIYYSKIRTLVFYSIMILSFITELFFIFETRGEAIAPLFFKDKNDTFMDYFNTLIYSKADNPYSVSIFANYPAFAMLLFRMVQFMVPENLIDQGSFALRDTQTGRMSVFIFLLIAILLLFIIFYQGDNKKDGKKLFSFCVLFSSPFLFLYERGNILLYAIVFLYYFVSNNHSESKIVRELSFVALAVSCTIKVYPAIFGMILLKEKRYKDALHSLFYGILLFMIPFLCFGSITDEVTMLIYNLANNNALYNMNHLFSYRVDLYALLIYNGVLLGVHWGVSKFILYFSCFVMLVLAYISESKWKTLTLLCAIMVYAIDYSGQYLICFFCIPLKYFLDGDKTENKWLDIGYAVLFSSLFVLIPMKDINSFKALESYRFSLNWVTFVESTGLFLLVLTIVIDESVHLIGRIHAHVNLKKKTLPA